MQALFWSIFNPLDTSDLHINSQVRVVGIIGEFLYAAYMVVVVVVMLNALIAMMSNTYTRVEVGHEKYERDQMSYKFPKLKITSLY